MKLKLNRLPEWLFLAIGIFLVIRLFSLSVHSASDFEVYWYAIQAWVNGQPPYAHYSFAYPGLVFKYPPWILPLFLPFVKISLSVSKILWTGIQVLCILYSMNWLRCKGVHTRIVCLVSLMFWWMWLAHAHFGQVMVPILAFSLWAHGETKSPFSSSTKLASLAYLLTSKVFSVVSLFGVFRKPIRWRSLSKVILFGISIFCLSHFALLIFHPHFPQSLQETQNLFTDLYQSWIHAASSGGAELGAINVRGQQNHSFVAAILRNIYVDATWVHWDISIAVALALLLGLLWDRFAKPLSSEEKWAGWLAIGVIAHPLAWHHSFTLVFPLCAFSLHQAVLTRDKRLVGISLLGTACIGLLIPQVIGVDAVVPLETVGSKSWGTVITAVALILSRRQKQS